MVHHYACGALSNRFLSYAARFWTGGEVVNYLIMAECSVCQHSTVIPSHFLFEIIANLNY